MWMPVSCSSAPARTANLRSRGRGRSISFDGPRPRCHAESRRRRAAARSRARPPESSGPARAQRPLAGRTVNAASSRAGRGRTRVSESMRADRVDVRATDASSQDEAEAAIRALAAATEVPDTTVDVERRARHRPMEKLERSGRLVDHAVAIARRLGVEVKDTATGGASDANTTSGLGVPTLDGSGRSGQRPLAGGIPRPRFGGAADRAVCRAPARGGTRPGVQAAAWLSAGGSRPAARGRHRPGTAGQSSSAMRATFPVRPTPGLAAGRFTRVTRRRRPRRVGDRQAG